MHYAGYRAVHDYLVAEAYNDAQIDNWFHLEDQAGYIEFYGTMAEAPTAGTLPPPDSWYHFQDKGEGYAAHP